MLVVTSFNAQPKAPVPQTKPAPAAGR